MKLKNGEIWKAYPQLVELSQLKLPIKSSLGIAKLANKLNQPYIIIEGERNKLVQKYGRENEETKQVAVTIENQPDFIKELDEMFDMEWDDDIKFERIKIPDKITGTCDKCNHNMDITFEIEPGILIPLEDKFVGIE